MTAHALPKQELLSVISEDLPFLGITTSSEEVREGDLFLAFRGTRFDGSCFIDQALSKGAAFAVSETKCGERIVRCRSLIALLYEMAGARLKEVAPRVVAVTGSVGKSTYLAYTKNLLCRHMRIHLPNGNYNTDVGMPMTILAMPRSTELLLLEMGARRPGDIARLSLLAKPHVAVITRIGHSHLETLGDLRGVLRAKSEILLGLQTDGTLIYSHDDPLLCCWSRSISCNRIGVSLKELSADLSLIESKEANGLTLKFKDIMIEGIALEKRGEASELAAALSAATALTLGIPPEEIGAALPRCRAPSMRQEQRVHDGILYIMDAYNASPESAAAALELLRKSEVKGRRMALLGDMLELGCDADTLHFSIGVAAFKAGVTDLFCIGSLGKKIAEGAAFSGLPKERIHLFDADEKPKLSAALKSKMKKGDALLLKASRRLELEHVLSALTE